jgi:hypothetical protein
MTRTPPELGSVAVAIVTSIALTFTAAIGLVIDGGHILLARGEADAVAFQAARAGAQALNPAQLANGVPALDPIAARAVATRAAERILTAEHSTGRIAIVTADTTTVSVSIQERTDLSVAALFDEPHATVTGHATVRVAAGVTHEGN